MKLIFISIFIMSGSIASGHSESLISEDSLSKVEIVIDEIQRDSKLGTLEDHMASGQWYFPDFVYPNSSFGIGEGVIASWLSDGFTLKTYKETDQEKAEKTLQAIESIGINRPIKNLEKYSVVDVRKLRLRSAGQQAEVCVSVFWNHVEIESSGSPKNLLKLVKNWSPKTLNICGAISMAVEGDGLRLVCSNWKANDSLDQFPSELVEEYGENRNLQDVVVAKSGAPGLQRLKYNLKKALASTDQNVAEELVEFAQLSLLTIYSQDDNFRVLLNYLRGEEPETFLPHQ